MKHLVLLLLLAISPKLYAQTAVYDTVYHPFYDHMQLIEIKVKEYIPAEKGFVATSDAKELPAKLPVYILRNDRGEIIETYNAGAVKWKSSVFLSPEKSKTKQLFHLKKAKNTSMWVGNDDSGYNILYAVYENVNTKELSTQNYRTGLMDSLGKLRFPVEFENIRWIDSVFIARKEGMYYLYDHNFRKILDNGYEEINYVNTISNCLIVKQNASYGMVRRNGQVLMPLQYEAFRDSKYMHGYYEFLQNGKWGFVTHDFSQLITPFSPSPNLFKVGAYYMYFDAAVWTLIDANGKEILRSPRKIHDVLSPTRFLIENYTTASGYERSICDENGKVLTDKLYYDLYKINPNTVLAGYETVMNEYAQYRQSTKWLLLDADGNNKTGKAYLSLINLDSRWFKAYEHKDELIVIDDRGQKAFDFPIDDIYKYSDHVFRITRNKKYTFIDLNNPQVRSAEYDIHQAVKGNRIAVEKNGKWGFMDSSFREIIPPMMEKVENYIDGITAVQMNGKWLVIDEGGYKLSEIAFDEVKLLQKGFSQVSFGGKYGIMNRQGKFTVPVVYDAMPSVISQGDDYLIAVRKNDKYGIVNIQNETLYPFNFGTYAEISVHASIAQKRADGFYALLTITKRSTSERYYLNFDPAKNQLIIEKNYTNGFKTISTPKSTHAKVLFGVANWDGEMVIPCIYDGIGDYKNYTFRIYTSTGGGLVDTTGRILIPPAYKYLYDMASNYIMVGRHSGPWGLYTYQGKMIADTLYGGFEPPVFSLIPFYANFNYRYDPAGSWEHDEKKIGFMDLQGNIVLDAVYTIYNVPDRNKEEIVLYNETSKITIDGKGKVIRQESRYQQTVAVQPKITQPLTKKEKRQAKKKKHKNKMRMI